MTDDLRRALDAADKAVDDLCQGRLRWEMRVPAEPDHDPDLIISKALGMARAALAARSEPRAEGLADAERYLEGRDDINAATRSSLIALARQDAATPPAEGLDADIRLLVDAILGGTDYKPHREAAERVLAALAARSEPRPATRADVADSFPIGGRAEPRAEGLREALLERWHAWNAAPDGSDEKGLLGMALMQDAFDALPDILAAEPRAEKLDGNVLRAAIDAVCSLTNPRLSEVDWDAVAAALAPEQPE